jgi:hypothetical protein
MSDVREQLADYAHEAWSGWMTYLFSKCAPGTDGDEFADGSLVIPPWAVERWKRQAATAYTDLPEPEKESDREEADRMLAIVEPYIEALHQALFAEFREKYRKVALTDAEVWAAIEEEHGIGRSVA